MEGIGWLHPPIPASGALGQRGALSVSLESWPSTPNETKEAHGAAISPPARRLPLVGDWMARGSMVEGIGWLHPPIPASGALGQRGALSVSLVHRSLRRPTRRRKLTARRSCGDLATGLPPARRLPLVGDWMARGSMAEGIGWLHSPIPASIGALRRRGALRGSRIVALDAKVNH